MLTQLNKVKKFVNVCLWARAL